MASGATAQLRGRRREPRTLRALGWGRSEIRRLLLQELALLAFASSLAVGLHAYLAGSSRWHLTVGVGTAGCPGGCRDTDRRSVVAGAPGDGSGGPDGNRNSSPWASPTGPTDEVVMLCWTTRNLLRAPKRTALAVLVIAAYVAPWARIWPCGGHSVAPRLLTPARPPDLVAGGSDRHRGRDRDPPGWPRAPSPNSIG